MTSIDDKITHWEMLFAENLTPDIEEVFIAHQQQIWDEMIVPTDCGHASYLWGRLLREKFSEKKIKYISGSYLGALEDREVRQAALAGSSPPGATEHVWLEIDGWIFDPTAAQFSPVTGQFSSEDYLPDRIRDIDQVIAEEEEIFTAEQEELRKLGLIKSR